MQQREKVLLAGLACVAGFFVLKPFVTSTFFEPLADRRSTLESQTREIADKDVEELALIKATSRLKSYKDRSLPPNSQVAQSLYLEWLTDIAQLTGLSDVRMTLMGRQPKDNVYVTVPVTIDAQGTTDQVARFLQHFESVDLLHRLTKLDMASKTHEGNPIVNVTMTAEGLSMNAAPARSRLFPQTTLSQACDAKETQLTVELAKEFQLPVPFRVRAGSELLTVTQLSGDGNIWTVERGESQTAAAPHAKGSPIELFPQKKVASGTASPETIAARLVATSFFAKPTPPVNYNPRFAAVPVQRVIRGAPFSFQLKVESWNPSFGKPIYKLADTVPNGMSIEASTGIIKWTPPETADIGPVSIVAVATSPTGLSKPVEGGFTLEVKPANHAPRVKRLDPVTVYLGRKQTIQIEAEDSDLPDDRLSYSFEGTSPAGARIDQRNGQIEIVAPPETELGLQTFTIKVQDSGDPAGSATTPLSIQFEDDAAAFTFLVGCLAEGDGRGEAMLHDRTTNQILRLHPGDLVKRADLEFIVLEVQPREVTYASGDGVFKLGFGSQLRQAVKVPLAAAKAPAAEPTIPAAIPVPVEEG